MKHKKLILLGVLLLVFVIVLLVSMQESDHGHGDDAHVTHTGEDVHEEDMVIELSDEQIAEIGIELSEAKGGRLDVYVSLPGEVAVNSDRMAHIVPRVGGVVEEVRRTLGDKVKAGDVMAVIRSRDLADAKAGYLGAIEYYDLAKTTFEREENLWKEKVSSEQDYLDAKRAFSEARIEMRSAEQKLLALGLGKEYLAKLSSEPQELFTRFEITAPFGGTVIDKHITLGEVVTDSKDVFTIADLSSVWVDLHVYQKDLMLIEKGQKVVISFGEKEPDVEGTISYVGPVVGLASRTALARVVLDNKSGRLRPGLFVTAKVAVLSVDAKVVIGLNAVQSIEGRKCVFIKDDHGFEPRFVTLGQISVDRVEVISGLSAGEQYVTEGAFELKANIATSSLDSHAGHGH